MKSQCCMNLDIVKLDVKVTSGIGLLAAHYLNNSVTTPSPVLDRHGSRETTQYDFLSKQLSRFSRQPYRRVAHQTYVNLDTPVFSGSVITFHHKLWCDLNFYLIMTVIYKKTWQLNNKGKNEHVNILTCASLVQTLVTEEGKWLNNPTFTLWKQPWWCCV